MRDIQSTGVKCDESGCDWQQEIEFEDVPEWHNVLCPSCGKGIIVTDEDLEVWRVVRTLMQLQEAMDPDGKVPKRSMTLRSKDLR